MVRLWRDGRFGMLVGISWPLSLAARSLLGGRSGAMIGTQPKRQESSSIGIAKNATDGKY